MREFDLLPPQAEAACVVAKVRWWSCFIIRAVRHLSLYMLYTIGFHQALRILKSGAILLCLFVGFVPL